MSNYKLSDSQVEKIRERAKAGNETHEHIARAYGISRWTVTMIANNRIRKPVPPKYDPTIATDPVTMETVFIQPEPKPLPRWDGADVQQSRRAAQLKLEGAGIRPCLSASNQWLGCPYPSSETLCEATKKKVNGQDEWLACILKPGEHKVPEGYYPPTPKVSRIIAEAKQTDEARRRTHTNALTVKKAAQKRNRFAQLQVPEPQRMRQYVAGKWVTRIFENGRWQDEPDDRQPAQPAGA